MGTVAVVTILFILMILSPWLFGLQATIIIAVLWLACVILNAVVAKHNHKNNQDRYPY